MIPFLLLLAAFGEAEAQDKYWVFFSDKGPEACTLAEDAGRYLSPRALARRARAGYPPNAADLPVSRSYLRALREAGMEVTGTSRWLNAASIRTERSVAELRALCPAITSMQPVARFQMTDALPPGDSAPDPDSADTAGRTLNYGMSADQLNVINLPCLHDRGFTGDGVLMAVFDAGFFRVDSLAPFDSLWSSGRALAWYDFVNQDSGIFDESAHGLGVISTIVANAPGTYVGAAPHVSVMMARTENVFSETHQEEDNWLMAMEWADSAGADIIQSSLGYNTFDPNEGDYTYQDMNGDSAIVTRAADMAAARGILVVNSAGNEANGPWHYITAPCDADSILCTGAVDLNGDRASFSSVGPTADGRIKPDVMAMGAGTAMIGGSGQVTFGSGTSFAAPQMAGLAACLIQAHPQRSNMEIIDAIRRSADRYLQPDTSLGYGVPDACAADSILTVMDSLSTGWEARLKEQVRIYPVPAGEQLVLELLSAEIEVEAVEVVAQTGAVVHRIADAPFGRRTEISLKDVASGIYMLKLTLSEGKSYSHKFIRQ